MKIVVTHSSNFNFKDDLYEPILSSSLNDEHDFLLPQEKEKEQITKEIIKNADLVFAEVSYPSTGQGIELGWADMFNIPIVCFCKEGKKPSSSVYYMTKAVVTYSDSADLISKLRDALNQKT